MVWGLAVAAGTVVGGVISSQNAADAQASANAANAAQTAQQLNEQRFQFDVTRGELSQSRRDRENAINTARQLRFDEQIKGLDPFSEAGRQASTEQAALLGLSGDEAQQAAFTRISESPGQAFLRERQERALLRNTSAIGGLGGGNIRTALQAQAFGRAQADIDRQIERLGGVVNTGLRAVEGQIGDPGFVQTGTDVGVLKGGVRKPLDPISQSRSSGGILSAITKPLSGLF